MLKYARALFAKFRIFSGTNEVTAAEKFPVAVIAHINKVTVVQSRHVKPAVKIRVDEESFAVVGGKIELICVALSETDSKPYFLFGKNNPG